MEIHPSTTAHLATVFAVATSLLPSREPTRVVMPIESPKGSMKLIGSTLYAMACAASASVPTCPA